MRRLDFILLLLLFFSFISKGLSWGFFGHEKINLLAVYSIPKPLFGFYKHNRQYMMAHAADPDKRRYSDTNEACRHYLDADFYQSSFPDDTLPKSYFMAIEKYGKELVHHHGIVPWQVLFKFYEQTNAFKEKNSGKVLRISAELGHYVGDCHVPLHSTSNYNGQKTGQTGIHALWESRLTELNFENYDLFCGLAEYIRDPGEYVWSAFDRSYSLVDSVLLIEAQVSKLFQGKSKYDWVPKGNVLVRSYSLQFCEAYHSALNGMVEDRLKSSIHVLASLIYTAWVNAGEPLIEGMPMENEPILPIKEKMIGRDEE